MKKFSFLMASVLVLSMVLSACQPAATPTAAPTAAPAATTAPATAAPAATTAPAATAVPAATTAPAATATTAASNVKPDCTKPEVLCVGLVTDVGKIDDKSFNQSAWEGVQKAQTDLGAYVQYIETTDPKDYGKNISTFAEAKFDVIVTVGFALGESTIAAAKQYPDVKFIGVDQAQTDTIPNLSGLIFPEDQAGYIVGVLAALMSKSGKIGAVLGTDAVPAVWRYGEGYKAGAKSVKSTIELNVVYHNDVGFDKTFSDPEWGKTTALSMIDKGVDVVFGAGGKTGNGALLGAAEKNVYAIGVDTDQYLTVPEAQKVMLSSAMKLETPGVFDLIKLVKDGKFPAGNYTGQAGYAPYHDLDSKVPADVKAKVDAVAKGLLDGSVKTGVLPSKPAK